MPFQSQKTVKKVNRVKGRLEAKFQKAGAHKFLKPERLVRWVTDPEIRKRYVAAMQRSDIEAMLHYYKANYPRTQNGPAAAKPAPMPKVRPPVLMIHGLEDKALLAAGLNDTWEWLENDLTLVTVPKAGHFVQHDASQMVSRSFWMWLHRDGAPVAISRALNTVVNKTCPFSGKPIRADCLTSYQDKVVGFCNSKCRDKFAADPDKFADQIEGLKK